MVITPISCSMVSELGPSVFGLPVHAPVGPRSEGGIRVG